MSLKEKLNKLENKGEERKVNLRMPKNKVDLLDKLAKHFGTNTSTLIREMIDDAIIQLQRELVVLEKDNGIEVTKNDESKEMITYLPSVIELFVPELYNYSNKREDFSSDEEYESFYMKDAELSVRYGISAGFSGTTPISKKSIEFYDNDFVNVDSKKTVV
ncbi:MAG: hypothetical protein WA945_04335 [Arcobacteraceae bacterium]